MRQFMHASVMVLASTMLQIGRTTMWYHTAGANAAMQAAAVLACRHPATPNCWASILPK